MEGIINKEDKSKVPCLTVSIERYLALAFKIACEDNYTNRSSEIRKFIIKYLEKHHDKK